MHLILSAITGNHIYYMTSFVSNEEDYINAIERAILRGVHIRLLLMMPLADVPVVKSRYEDYYHKSFDSEVEFANYISGKARRFLHLKDRINSNSAKINIVGSFSVRFYTKSLNFPLVGIRCRRLQSSALVLANSADFCSD